MRGLKVGDKVRVIEKPRPQEYPFNVGEVLTIIECTESIIGNKYYYYFKDRGCINGTRVIKYIPENRIGGEIL